MPARPLLLALACLLVLAGCGSKPAPRRALAPARRTVEAPQDASTVDASKVEVHGQVWPPDATVLVAGDEAGVDRGGFSAVVDVHEGANVIDVTAGGPPRAAPPTPGPRGPPAGGAGPPPPRPAPPRPGPQPAAGRPEGRDPKRGG